MMMMMMMDFRADLKKVPVYKQYLFSAIAR
jgi:hypothetical protein